MPADPSENGRVKDGWLADQIGRRDEDGGRQAARMFRLMSENDEKMSCVSGVIWRMHKVGDCMLQAM